ncbi:zinc finger protein 286A-like isoform X2 [Ostrinia furnacalis]|uniref:zinc finger protein 286A-like isoform X2 n=1 Tax=Ostrinia furnacalis TaxID=93504 RepID=UPI00103EC535|nr:zinc finger protein 286A-like isoform X2 [Ostrinia furnacalis]
MDLENINSWVSQPDVCRCCLSASGTWDVTASYISDSGIKEVYFEMLRDCYGITLSYLSKWGPSRMVCKLCVGHLREACSFRDQVRAAEKHFTEYCSSRDHNTGMVTVKLEENVKANSPEADFSDRGVPSEDENNLISPPVVKPEKRIQKRKKQKTDKVRRKKKKTETEYDSDTPIANMIDKNEPSCDDNKAVIGNVKDEIPNVERPPHTGANGAKHLSDRKRVMLTCDVVLRHTTACPFRHHKSWFQCFFCSQGFMEMNLLRNHTLQDHSNVDSEIKKIKRYPRSLQIDISNLECRNCHSPMTDVNEMRRHLSDAHSKVIYNECIADYKVNASPFTCHICKQEFHVFRTLTTHINEHYANCICEVCGKSFLNSKRLKVHKRTHESGNFPCSECGKVLKTKTSQANHMESAHSKRQMKCQICFKPMKHYNERIKHMSEVHNITHKFKCPICGREYNIKHYLATHIRQTHGHKNKKCSECGMAFITNHGLKKHMLKHSGVKPFSCNVCSKSYARSYTLKEHMRVHDNDRRFGCPE